MILFRAANCSDLEGVLELLTSVGLPVEGVQQSLGNFVVAEVAGNIVGCAGFERYDKVGLLRSVAVRPDIQSLGLGSRLVACVVKDAASIGVEEVILLTTTAKNFFEGRHGFHVASRNEYDSRLAASQEWTLPRCASAVLLRKFLT